MLRRVLLLQLGMVHAVGLDLGTTLIATGLYNIATGVQFGIPMCVQVRAPDAGQVVSRVAQSQAILPAAICHPW
jgi:hypothetical protein